MTMNVRQMIEWMSTFEDQDAIVEVVVHREGRGYYDQGGNAETEEFNPEQHVEYTDLRGNKIINESAPYYNRRSVVLGIVNG